MSTPSPSPTLHFFGRTPANLDANPPLASSLQSLETCFFLLAYHRYPHALLACASAVESVIRAKLKRPPDDETPFRTLLEEIRNYSHNLRLFDGKKLTDLRQTRNRIVHYGFSPTDDEKCVRLLMLTGLPFLKRCYEDLFGFYLDEVDLRRSRPGGSELTPEEQGKVGLMWWHAKQLRVAIDVFSKAKEIRGLSVINSVSSFAHHVRYAFRSNALGDAAEEILEDGDLTFDSEKKQKEEWRKILRQSTIKDECFEFFCPICDGCNTLVAQINEDRLDEPIVSFRRGYCVKCGLLIPDYPYLADALLEPQIRKMTEEILTGYGIEERPKT